MNEAKIHKGGCNCGSVRYELKGEPSVVVACHCLNCQRQGGAAFSVNLIMAHDQVTIIGMPKIYLDQDTDSGNDVRRHFCGNCGSPIMTLSDKFPHIAVIKAGTLDERSGFEPQLQCFTDTAFGWASFFDQKPSFARNPEL